MEWKSPTYIVSSHVWFLIDFIYIYSRSMKDFPVDLHNRLDLDNMHIDAKKNPIKHCLVVNIRWRNKNKPLLEIMASFGCENTDRMIFFI